MPQIVTDADFNENVIKSKGVVIVDFWAEWCPPCHALAPVLEQVEKEAGDKATILKLDVDANPKSAQTHQISSIPTVKVFKDGEEIAVQIGVQPKHVYLELINQNS